MKRIIYYCIKLVAKFLPRWKNAKSIKVLSASPEIPVTTPVNLGDFPKGFASYFISTINIPERRIFILEKVNVLGTGIVYKNLRLFLPSLSWMEDFKLFNQGHVYIRQWFSKISPVTSPIALVYDYWASVNYYHWMIDTLPKLLVLQNRYPGCQLIVPEKLPEYIKTTTGIFGFNNLLPLKNYDSVKTKKLIYPEATAPIGFQDPALIKTVSAVIKKHFSALPGKDLKYVYISRSRQKIRQLHNEKQALDVLIKYGFETVFFEELSLEEQINMIKNTSIVLAVNGSNLVNILFLQERSIVIELMNKNVNNTCTYSLASSLSLPYFCIPCEIANPGIDLTNYVENNNADIYVDLVQLEETLLLAIKLNLKNKS